MGLCGEAVGVVGVVSAVAEVSWKESLENALCKDGASASVPLEATGSGRGWVCGIRMKSSSGSNSLAVHTISSSSEEDSSMASSADGGKVNMENEEPERLEAGEHTLSRWVEAIVGDRGSVDCEVRKGVLYRRSET